MGCQALVLDFLKHKKIEADADQTYAALQNVGCNVIYYAPKFLIKPRSYRVYHYMHVAVIHPSQESIDKVIHHNRAEHLSVKSAIETHRSIIESELAVQVVQAHGSKLVCGSWGPGFSTGSASFRRRDFHHGNYIMMHGKVCESVAVDRSCYSGNTAKLIDELNNTGEATCSDSSPTINHSFHGAFHGDMAITSSQADRVTINGEMFLRDLGLAGMIERYGRFKQVNRVADGLRQEIVDEVTPPSGIGADGKYSDMGYQQTSSSSCEEASHVRLY